ncbi:MAG: alpha/beta hydrolase family protein [Thermoleophilaceae bacterium]
MGPIIHEAPEPPRLGTHNGMAYALFTPREDPKAGVVILHGAGSAKENHFDYGRAARDHGFAALAFDARGHGRSEGKFGPTAIEDAVTMCELLGEEAPAVALRGSSLGGFVAIHAGAGWGQAVAVVALCPAPEDLLLRSLRSGQMVRFEFDQEAIEPWLEALDLYEAVGRLGPKTALLLMHAEGDEQIPYTVSEELHAQALDPKRLLVLPGGHHRSLQHDGEMQGESLRFIARAVG